MSIIPKIKDHQKAIGKDRLPIDLGISVVCSPPLWWCSDDCDPRIDRMRKVGLLPFPVISWKWWVREWWWLTCVVDWLEDDDAVSCVPSLDELMVGWFTPSIFLIFSLLLISQTEHYPLKDDIFLQLKKEEIEGWINDDEFSENWMQSNCKFEAFGK